MSDIFHSSKYMIARAKHHLSDFERQLDEFFKTNPYESVVDIDTNTSEKVQKLKLVKPLPAVLPAIAADTVNNLRSALDQAIFAISSTIGVKKTYFPFAKDGAHFQNAVKGRCKDLPQEITDLICTFKPYKGGNNLLWALNELSNTNKHAIICPTAMVAGERHIKYMKISGNIACEPPVWDRLKNEMELFRQSLDSVVEFNFDLTLYVAVCNVEFVDGQEAQVVLNEFVRIVEDVITALEAESNRLGIG
jgi:hypothetical protein